MIEVTKLEIALNLIGDAVELLYQLESQINEDKKKDKIDKK